MKHIATKAILVLLMVSACVEKSRNDDESKKNNQISFNTDYKPPSFKDSERMKKFNASFPAIDSIFLQHAEKNHYPGLVFGIVADGELIHSGFYGVVDLKSNDKVTNDSEFHIASMTKSFTSMAIIKLRDEGKLHLDDMVANYIPEVSTLTYLTSDATPISIKNLMTMSTGLPEDNPWADRQLEDTEEEFVRLLSGGLSFSSTPSSQYEYSNLGYAMLGTIITRVTAMPYQEYITENILRPLEMNHTYWDYDDVPAGELAIGYRWEDDQWKEEPMLHTGAYGSIGGLITSMKDFSKYVSYLLSAWPERSSPEVGPVKRSSLREMQNPTFPRLSPNSKNLDGEPCPVLSGYAFGLGYRKDCDGIVRISHSGGLPGFGSEYRLYPDYGFAVISFSNRTYAGTGNVNSKVVEQIMDYDIQSRKRFVSKILAEREMQVKEFIENWNDDLGNEIFAENFYLDVSKEIRKGDYDDIISDAGGITSVEPIIPINQMRGTFIMRGDATDVQVFFSLSPEKEPKIQALYYWNVEKGYEIGSF